MAAEVSNADLMLVSIKVAAERLGLGQYEVKTLIDSGRIPAEKIGRTWYIPASALREFVAAMTAARPA